MKDEHLTIGDRVARIEADAKVLVQELLAAREFHASSQVATALAILMRAVQYKVSFVGPLAGISDEPSRRAAFN